MFLLGNLFKNDGEVPGFLSHLNQSFEFGEIIHITNPVSSSKNLPISTFEHFHFFSAFFQIDYFDGVIFAKTGEITGTVVVAAPAAEAGFTENVQFGMAFNYSGFDIKSDIHNIGLLCL